MNYTVLTYKAIYITFSGSPGQMLGKILNVEGVLPDKKFDQLRSNDLYEDR